MTQTPVFDIPATSDYTVSVNGKPITVYAMPTRYGQSFKDGKPDRVRDRDRDWDRDRARDKVFGSQALRATRWK